MNQGQQTKIVCDLAVTSVEAMSEVVDVVLATLHENQKASVVGLFGELGAGKTAFVRKFLAQIGVSDTATSPTFVVRKAYNVPEGISFSQHFSRVVHVDAYRLEGSADAAATGILSDIDNGKTLLLVEWPERLDGLLENSGSYLGTLHFEHIDEQTRRVRLEI